MRSWQDVWLTDEGPVRVSPIEATILEGSFGQTGRGFPPTPKALAIVEACQRVAEWRKRHASCWDADTHAIRRVTLPEQSPVVVVAPRK